MGSQKDELRMWGTIFLMGYDAQIYSRITTIIKQVNRMGELTGKLHKITKYQTKDYLEGKIIDIDRAAS